MSFSDNLVRIDYGEINRQSISREYTRTAKVICSDLDIGRVLFYLKQDFDVKNFVVKSIGLTTFEVSKGENK